MLHDIADAHGVEYRTVEDIYFHQWEYLAEMIAKGDKVNFDSYENVLLGELGSFIANEKHIYKLRDIKNAKQTDVPEV